MSWTTPRTWVTDELVTAALMNAHIRDNFNSTMHMLAYKSADETVSSSTTLQDDNDLLLTVGASDVWALSFMLVVTDASGGSADFKVAFTFPASGVLNLSSITPSSSGTISIFRWSTSASSQDLMAVTAGTSHLVTGTYAGGGTAGTIQVQWAQATSSASNVTLVKGSNITGAKLA